MNAIRPQGFNIMPLVTKNLLIINGLVFLAVITYQNFFIGGYDPQIGYHINKQIGLYYIGSEHFMPVQFITYMFLHGDFYHLLSNMFVFWMFGTAVENYWGPKRFLIYYMATGIGAAIVQQFVGFVRIEALSSGIDPEILSQYLSGQTVMINPALHANLESILLLHYIPTVGASGSVFGILLAFGMLFPNALIYIYFAIPVKAKWLVLGYGLFELYRGIANNPGDNVAHFAHLGGMLFGFLLIKYWKKTDNPFNRYN